MNTLTATYKIVTPMFIGGADQSPVDGIRPPSVKGALRFWWRALNWGRFWEEAKEEGSREVIALQALHAEEARLFGSTAEGKKGGQGCFLLSVKQQNLKSVQKETVHKPFCEYAAARYLGYGVMEAFASRPRNVKAGQLIRGCLTENQMFKVQLIFKKNIDESIQEALIALGLLGGLGSRSRHGLGCLSLEKLEGNIGEEWKKPDTKKEYHHKIQELLKGKLSARDCPPYTCFSQSSRVEHLFTENTYYEALNNFGSSILMYRSWGKNGKVLNQVSEKNFKGDHDWSKDISSIPNGFHPQRVVFGLPHNYGNKSVISVNYERRNSPLLLHIHQINNDCFIAIGLFMPALFLPDGEKIKAGGKEVENNADFSIIHGFMDGKDRFPDKQSLLPEDALI